MDKEKEVKEENRKMRQVIIETDGNSLKIVKAEVAGTIELQGLLVAVLESLKK